MSTGAHADNRSLWACRANEGFIRSDAMPPFLDRVRLLSFNPLAGNRSGLRLKTYGHSISVCSTFRLWSASLAQPTSPLLRPLLTSPRYSALIAQHPASMLRSTGEISRGKTRNCRCIDAGFTKYTPAADGGLRGHVPARPGCTTPYIRFLFIAPQLWVRLPSDSTSR